MIQELDDQLRDAVSWERVELGRAKVSNWAQEREEEEREGTEALTARPFFNKVCLFYLVLRGLDTIEDDMTLPLDRKVELLRSFDKIIYQRGWNFNESE